MQVKAIELYFRVASVIVYKVLPIVMCMPVCIKTKYVTNLMKAIEKLSHMIPFIVLFWIEDDPLLYQWKSN